MADIVLINKNGEAEIHRGVDAVGFATPEGGTVLFGEGGGSISREELEQAIEAYLEENPIEETDPTVPSWAKVSTKPSYNKSEVGLGNVDNVKQYSASNPPPYPVTSVNGKTGDVSLAASDVGARPNTWTPTYSDVGADKSGAATSAVSGHNTNTAAHNDIRLLITALTTRLDALANSDDDTLDQMAEVVAYIKANRDLIDQITTGKVSVSDIINNLTTSVANKPLSAAQGVALKALIDAIIVPTKLSELAADSTHRTVTDTEKAAWSAKSNFSGNYADLSGKPTIPTVPTKVSAFTNDAGYLKSYTETDPTVPSWAKASKKPSYTSDEIGVALNLDWQNPVDAPGTLTAALLALDSLIAAIEVPTKLSDLTNNMGFISSYTETDPTVPSWAKAASKPSYSASEVGAVPTSRTVNGKALSSNISLSASDVGALASASYTTKVLTVTYDDNTTETVTLVVAK